MKDLSKWFILQQSWEIDGSSLESFHPWASEMDQWVKVPAAKTNDLSSIPGTGMIDEDN